MGTLAFNIGNKVVYPSHGVGEVVNVETQEVCGVEVQFYVIDFDQNKMTIRIPVKRAQKDGLRNLAANDTIDRVYDILRKTAKTVNPTKMWNRKVKEYGDKIHSGNITAVAEVVRDLYKESDNRSYSERNIYQLALSRLAEELSVLEDLNINQVTVKLVEILKTKGDIEI